MWDSSVFCNNCVCIDMLVLQYHEGHTTARQAFSVFWATQRSPWLDLTLSSGSEGAEE